MNYLNVVYGLCLLFFSCAQPEEVMSDKQAYFDFPDFIAQEQNRLVTGKFSLTKVLHNESKTDSTQQSSPDWSKELQLFQGLDINKPAFIGKYSIKSEKCADSLICEHYVALDSTLLIRKLIVSRLGDMVREVYILKDDHAMFLDNRIEVNYFPSQGFTVKGYRNLLGFETSYEVHGRFDGQ
ncbi:MAG: hypothetical protein ACK4GL_01910 [Flavobacteriales bacterium]